jgi:hypothetical protein
MKAMNHGDHRGTQKKAMKMFRALPALIPKYSRPGFPLWSPWFNISLRHPKARRVCSGAVVTARRVPARPAIATHAPLTRMLKTGSGQLGS